mmetsp:Transcript_19317/g.48087  ORF Transcript_19317/g.48087 Transcript_19317/m.48087 type:complete len:271 (+) Transcript_19317:313-1125(+)
MGTGSSSKTNDQDDVRDRLNSGEFQKISPPSSPSIQTKIDEMSYSGILVEKPESPASAAAIGASFAADLTTPPVSNRSKGRSKKDQPRRIVKATPPPASSQVVLDSNRNDNDVDSPAVHHHSESLASPIGANAVTEMLEESIEKNASKNKLMERVSNKQKSDREKLLQEKRRRQQPSSDKPKAEVNPFSRFLKAFSIDANPTHKRKESMDAADPNKRMKFGFDNSNKSEFPASSGEAEDSEDSMPLSWIAAASVATIAILVIAIVRSKKK